MGKYTGVFLNSFWFIFFYLLQIPMNMLGEKYFFIPPIVVIIFLILIVEANFYFLKIGGKYWDVGWEKMMMIFKMVIVLILIFSCIFTDRAHFYMSLMTSGSLALYGIARLYFLQTVNLLRDIFILLVMCFFVFFMAFFSLALTLFFMMLSKYNNIEVLSLLFSTFGIFVIYVAARLFFLRCGLKTELMTNHKSVS